ncbi:MAG: ATP-binding protein [Butyrivibrio sp.]|nr:ATP-binding protein [Acetatifactor muris]MCM1558623.1 ATP-binding protein [Butyrivibrio sp.]
MRKKVQTFSELQKHLFSILVCVFCMAAAAGISSACSYLFSRLSLNCTLVFVLFVILASCGSAARLYGVLCSVFAVFWLNLRLPPVPADRPTELLCAVGILTFLSLLTFRLAGQADWAVMAGKQLEEAKTEKMRANLLRAISHDLRSPLTGIIGNSLTYLEHQDSLTDAEKETLVRSIYEASSRLVNMVENLLTVTHIRNHNLTITTREESVEEVVAEALQRAEKQHPACSIRVSVPESFLMIPMDAALIEQVTVNLLENALLHSGADAPIDFIVEDRPDCVSFTVRDYGNGIPGNKLKHLFEDTDYAPPPAGARKGMGIGLVICKTIITAHHGTITGHNHSEGAEFIFTLPKRKENPHEFQN